MAYKFCFLDSELKEHADEETAQRFLPNVFDKIADLNKKEVMLHASYSTPFFELYSIHYRQPHVIFKEAGLNLTVFQKNLLYFSQALLMKLRNVNIPEAILKDPVKILDYEENKVAGKVTEGIEDLKLKSKQRGGELEPEDFLT